MSGRDRCSGIAHKFLNSGEALSIDKVCGTCSRPSTEVTIREGLKNCENCLEKGRAACRRNRERNLNKHRDRVRKYREENPHMAFYTTSRYQAKKAGAISDLSPEDALDIYLTPNICAYCGKDHGDNPKSRAVHIDHIIPMKQGGPNSRWNLTKVCIGCNSSKETESLISFRERTPAFTQERYDAVVAEMAQRSSKSAAEIAQLLEQSHAFEIAFKAERERMVGLLAA